MDKSNYIIGIIALIIGALIGYALHGSGKSVDMLGGAANDCGANTCLTSLYVTPGTLYVDGASTFATVTMGAVTTGAITSSGNLSVTTTGTTTLSLLSTSATKGFCINLNATSSNTRLNLTATSSTQGNVLGMVLAYGACN